MVPLGGQNFIIKGRGRLRKQSIEKERKKRFLEKRTISKVVVKRKKTLRKKMNIASRYPVKATIVHTRIQRESNFASFEG